MEALTFEAVEIDGKWWAHCSDGTELNHGGDVHHAGPFDTREEAEAYAQERIGDVRKATR